MKRNAFGQLILSPHLVSFNDDAGAGGDGGEGDGAGNGGDGFKPPATQEELDRIIAQRVSRAERNAREDERRKLADAKPKGDDGGDKAKPDDKPAGLSDDDVDKRISEALAAERLTLALERVNDGLDKALEGRTYAASKLFNLDREQFVKDDGKTVDTEKLQKWVRENSTEVEGDAKRRRGPRGQGERDSNATGGSVSAGRDLYDENHTKKSSRKD